MSQLPSLSQDYPLQQYDQIQRVHSLIGKAIFQLNARAKWNLFDDLNDALEPGTPEGQWRELNAVTERVKTIADQENNGPALAKLAEAREIVNG